MAEFRILMVEDMTQFHELYAREINDSLDAAIDFAKTAEEAISKLQDQEFDLIILDLNLPGMPGDQLLENLRKDPKFLHTPVVILTGDTSQDTQTRLLSLGANEFIEKGSAPEVFIARLKAQVRQKQSIDKLTELASDRDAFAAGVLHDIRNIESSLLANCEILEMQLTDKGVSLGERRDQILEDLKTLKEQASRIGKYANNVIQKVRESGSEIRITEVNLQKLINAATHFVGEDVITIDVPEPLQSVKADEHLLQVVTNNILQNAVKYAREGVAPEISITQTARDNRIVTKFKDNGRGVNPDEIQKIFSPFYKGEAAYRTKSKSFGLGLSLVMNVIKKMQGDVWAESGTEPGLAICLSLPT